MPTARRTRARLRSNEPIEVLTSHARSPTRKPPGLEKSQSFCQNARASLPCKSKGPFNQILPSRSIELRDEIQAATSLFTDPLPIIPPTQKHRALDLREVWENIAEQLTERSDLLALSLVNKLAHEGVLSPLYRRPLITTSENQLSSVADFCSPENPGLKFIQHLTVAPRIKMLPCRKKRTKGSLTRAGNSQTTVVTRVVQTIPQMPSLQSIAFCNIPHDQTILTFHNMRAYKQEYMHNIIPDSYYDHAICLGQDHLNWRPGYLIWATGAGLQCTRAEQLALFESKLGKCGFDGVYDVHTRAWRICD